MTWLAVGTFLKALLGRLGAFLKSLSFWQLVSLGLACVIVVQHFTLVRARAEAARWEKQYTSIHTTLINERKAYAAAQSEAAAKELKQKQDTEARYAQLATQKDQEYAIGLQAGRAAALSYIAAHGLQSQSASPSGGPSAPAKDNSPIIPAKLPPDPVVVSAGDVQSCTEATAYAIAAHNWAISLTNDGSQPK